MTYIIYSPPHDFVVEEFERDGQTVPARTFPIAARALYKHRKYPNRRYRGDFHSIDPDLMLVKCRSLKRAREERDSLLRYCGEKFEIREFVDGYVGGVCE